MWKLTAQRLSSNSQTVLQEKKQMQLEIRKFITASFSGGCSLMKRGWVTCLFNRRRRRRKRVLTFRPSKPFLESEHENFQRVSFQHILHFSESQIEDLHLGKVELKVGQEDFGKISTTGVSRITPPTPLLDLHKEKH